MSHDHSDDDVIVLSEDEARYETEDEHAAVDPADSAADDDLAANDQATRAVPGEASRFGSMTSPGEAAASDPVAAEADESGAGESDPEADAGAHPVTEPVTPVSGSYGTGAEAPGYSGMTAAGRADSDVSGTPGNGNGNGTVNGNGSVISMPGSSATPAASATPAVTPAGQAASDSNWPQIQSLFVDDPLAAVQQAADVVGGALAALVAAANNREQTLRGGWQGHGTGTEELRTALREYRDLAARLSTLATDL